MEKERDARIYVRDGNEMNKVHRELGTKRSLRPSLNFPRRHHEWYKPCIHTRIYTYTPCVQYGIFEGREGNVSSRESRGLILSFSRKKPEAKLSLSLSFQLVEKSSCRRWKTERPWGLTLAAVWREVKEETVLKRMQGAVEFITVEVFPLTLWRVESSGCWEISAAPPLYRIFVSSRRFIREYPLFHREGGSLWERMEGEGMVEEADLKRAWLVVDWNFEREETLLPSKASSMSDRCKLVVVIGQVEYINRAEVNWKTIVTIQGSINQPSWARQYYDLIEKW